jgi:hypothetical protein
VIFFYIISKCPTSCQLVADSEAGTLALIDKLTACQRIQKQALLALIDKSDCLSDIAHISMV